MSEIPEDSERILKTDRLEPGDKILVNDRSRPLEVTGRETKKIHKTYRRRSKMRDHYDIVVLEGNGTTYHMLYQYGSGGGPILRSRSQWDVVERRGEETYNYRAGTRVEELQVL